jgi:hypothetical protein
MNVAVEERLAHLRQPGAGFDTISAVTTMIVLTVAMIAPTSLRRS